MNRFNVKIHNNDITVFHNRVSKYQKLIQFNENTNNQSMDNFERQSEYNIYKLTSYTRNEETYYLFMDTSYLNKDNSINMNSFRLYEWMNPLEKFANKSLQLNDRYEFIS